MRRRNRMRKKLLLIVLGLIFLAVLVKVVVSLWPAVPTAARVVFHPGATLKETNGRTNLVLLGIGGGTHDGPDLTDTIIFASINWKANTVTLVSIPRDLWIPSVQNDTVKKINEVYSLGENNTPPTGLRDAEKVVSLVTGQQVHYGIRLDFQGFIDAIDAIGGVDVNVQHTLDDYNYPISGKEDDTCNHTPEELQAFNASESSSLTPDLDTFTFFPCRFKHLHFDPGFTHMYGETALEFARSRHASGAEGTDFARSARQQLVIEAVRNKLITSAFFSPGKILNLFGIVKSSIDTDIADTDLGLFLDKLPQLKTAKILSNVIDFGNYATGRAGLLKEVNGSADYSYAYVLIPRVGNGNFTEIQQYVSCVLTKNSCSVSKAPITPLPSSGFTPSVHPEGRAKPTVAK